MDRNFIILAAVIAFAWYAWGRWIKPAMDARKALAIKPVVDLSRITADVADVTEFFPLEGQASQIVNRSLYIAEQESISALLTLRDRMEQVGATAADIESVLSLAPKLLAKQKTAS